MGDQVCPKSLKGVSAVLQMVEDDTKNIVNYTILIVWRTVSGGRKSFNVQGQPKGSKRNRDSIFFDAMQ